MQGMRAHYEYQATTKYANEPTYQTTDADKRNDFWTSIFESTGRVIQSDRSIGDRDHLVVSANDINKLKL